MDARSRRSAAAALGWSLALVMPPVSASAPRAVTGGHVEAEATAATLAGNGYTLQAWLSKETPPAVSQGDARFSLTARLAASALACTGGDIIFQNGFELP